MYTCIAPTLCQLPDVVKVQRVEAQRDNGWSGYVERIFVQLVFGLLYYFLIVDKYPLLEDNVPNKRAKHLQQMNAVTRAVGYGI